MQNDAVGKALSSIRQKLEGINAAIASLACLKQAMTEVPGARSAAERHWQTAYALNGGEPSNASLDAGIAKADEVLTGLANALKEDIAAWECEDLNGNAV